MKCFLCIMRDLKKRRYEEERAKECSKANKKVQKALKKATSMHICMAQTSSVYDHFII